MDTLEAFAKYREQNPELDEVLRLYEETTSVLARATHKYNITISASTTEQDMIFRYPADLHTHPTINQVIAWILPLYRHVRAQEWAWLVPHVPNEVAFSDEDIEMEWWYLNRKL